jgi:hypothetical protein
MSTTFGALRADRGLRSHGDQEASPREPDASAGRWQEELDLESYAESSMTLPGQGETGPNCGVWKPADFCDECAEVGFAPNRCERRSCPNCDGEWTRQRAVGATVRIQAKRHTEPKDVSRRVVHVAVSPPEGSITTLTDVYDGYRDAYGLAKRQGVRGGVAVFHGFRVREAVQEEFRDADPNMGVWRWIRTERDEDWRSLTYWSPHWHVIGLCRDLDEDNPEEQGGWVVRRMPTKFDSMDSLTDRESYDDVVGAVRYLMSHATFEAGTSRDCVRWFGELATTKFSPEQELSEGALSTVERVTEEVVGAGDDRGDGHAEEEPCEECGARSRSPIFDAGLALQNPSWCEEIGRENERRLKAAFEWVIGERLPPPGLKRNSSGEEAEEALTWLVENG